MSETKQFHIGAILSVISDKLLCPMGELYEILNHLTGDNLFTHQLPRAITECQPYLRECFPDLAAVQVQGVTPVNFRDWMDARVAELGSHRDVEPMPDGQHEYRNPVTELTEMVGPDRVVQVEL